MTGPAAPTRVTTIYARAPVRIDLAGGWTDVPLFAERYGGEVVSFAINLHSVAKLCIHEDGKISVNYNSCVAVGSGLGTSASLNVALVAAIDSNRSSRHDIAERAYQLETLLGNVGGRQDHWLATHGGFRDINFNKNAVTIQDFELPFEVRGWLKENLLIFDSGIRHSSGSLHTSIWRRLESGDEQCLAGFQVLKQAAGAMKRSLSNNDKCGVATALDLVCSGVDQIDERIHAPFKHTMCPLMRNEKVAGWKATGAGAGGCVIVLLYDVRFSADVTSACCSNGWKQLQWDYDNIGLVVECSTSTTTAHGAMSSASPS